MAAGPVTTAGLPNFLPASAPGTLTLLTANVSSTYPLVATAAAGWSATTGGPVDVIGYSTANLSWTGLTINRAAATPNFLYVTIANGLMTTGSTLLAPVYQWGGTPAVTAGQFTFNIAEMRGYLGQRDDGAAGQPGHGGRGGDRRDGRSSRRSRYAYNGRYASALHRHAAEPAALITTANHNIGVPASACRVYHGMHDSRQHGYAVGDRI